MSTHNICFHGEIRKLFTRYPLLSRPMFIIHSLFEEKLEKWEVVISSALSIHLSIKLTPPALFHHAIPCWVFTPAPEAYAELNRTNLDALVHNAISYTIDHFTAKFTYRYICTVFPAPLSKFYSTPWCSLDGLKAKKIKIWVFQSVISGLNSTLLHGFQPNLLYTFCICFNWWSGGCGFNPLQVGNIPSWRFDHEIFSMFILLLLLIQEGQLSVSGKWMCTILVNCWEDLQLYLPIKSVEM